jgi:TfoX/Sxy family transcriptional regulator of competence genes
MDALSPYPDKTRLMQYYKVPVKILQHQDVLLAWAANPLAVR